MKKRARACPDCKNYATSPMNWPCRSCTPVNAKDYPGMRTLFEPKEGGFRDRK